jgi:nucleotide-binding universal stress UspA family protein
MLRIKHILCPVDFFPASSTAANYAIALAKTYRAQLTLLHVVEPVTTWAYWAYDVPVDTSALIDSITMRATQELNKIADRAKASDVPVDVVIENGFVDVAIESLIRGRHIDFVIMGTHGRRGVEKLFFGSTTERLLRRLQIPVMTVRTPTRGRFSIRHILLATDFSEGTPDAIRYASSLAKQHQAKLTLLHVLDDLQADVSGRYREPLIRTIRYELESLVPSRTRNRLTLHVRTETGHAGRRILPIAKKDKVDLIVMNIHGKTLLDWMMTGRTAEKIVREATAPVLMVPAMPGAKRARRVSRKAA